MGRRRERGPGQLAEGLLSLLLLHNFSPSSLLGGSFPAFFFARSVARSLAPSFAARSRRAAATAPLARSLARAQSSFSSAGAAFASSIAFLVSSWLFWSVFFLALGLLFLHHAASLPLFGRRRRRRRPILLPPSSSSSLPFFRRLSLPRVSAGSHRAPASVGGRSAPPAAIRPQLPSKRVGRWLATSVRPSVGAGAVIPVVGTGGGRRWDQDSAPLPPSSFHSGIKESELDRVLSRTDASAAAAATAAQNGILLSFHFRVKRLERRTSERERESKCWLAGSLASLCMSACGSDP